MRVTPSLLLALLSDKSIAASLITLALSINAPCWSADDTRPASAESSRRPNIVLIFADDLGWKDVGYQGTDFYETPNIDRLASEGMVFTVGYAAAGNCQPSRACLISGQYTPRHDVYAVGSTHRGPDHLMRLVPIQNKTKGAITKGAFASRLSFAGRKKQDLDPSVTCP